MLFRSTQDASGQPQALGNVSDVTMDYAGPSPVNVPRSRTSSMSSGMGYDEAKDVSGVSHASILNHNALTGSLAQDPRIRPV